MKVPFSTVLDRIRSSYWFVPAGMSLLAVALSTLMLYLDQRFADRIPSDAWWLYGGDHEGARVVLSAIVTSMISVTSVVFSITIVALTLAAGQFGSRVLRNFMRDRGNQITLGTFIATFAYAILVLRTVRGVEDAEFVPPLAMSLGIVLVFVSVGVLIYFIHHVASSMQADSVVRSIATETEDAIDQLFPVAIEEGHRRTDPQKEGKRGGASLPTRFDAEAEAVRASRGDHLQFVDHETLMHLSVEHDLVVRLKARPGDFIVRGGIIAHSWKAGGLEPELLEEIRELFVLGRSRTLQQDAEFGIIQLVEVAVRALSTGINDPFTAMNCVDRISSLLCRLSGRAFPGAERFDEDGRLRVVADTSSFGGFVDSGFNQIRQNAGRSVAVLIRMLEALETIGTQTRTPEQRRALEHHAALVLEAGISSAPMRPRSGSFTRRAPEVLEPRTGEAWVRRYGVVAFSTAATRSRARVTSPASRRVTSPSKSPMVHPDSRTSVVPRATSSPSSCRRISQEARRWASPWEAPGSSGVTPSKRVRWIWAR